MHVTNHSINAIMRIIFLVFFLLWGVQAIAAAVEVKNFDTPEQERVYSSLISELRCLVCQNQTIADSNADLAKDLRAQVYKMLQQGKSRQEIVDFMTQRYGDFVLYNPPMKAKTSLLWLAPLLFLVIGLLVAWSVVRKKRLATRSESAHDSAQSEEIRRLLEQGDDR
ncbi:MAG: cytochrome c-type biogenesis protein CcmH [Gammaproteobacteria bacterium HGW-Gammaproteobacteria-10]|nr:MAG: cytochrome c-type biogenesis protein CcmH [Gammaproteobacteria bacterium HGW-Gammaproteobacteria-10]